LALILSLYLFIYSHAPPDHCENVENNTIPDKRDHGNWPELAGRDEWFINHKGARLFFSYYGQNLEEHCVKPGFVFPPMCPPRPVGSSYISLNDGIVYDGKQQQFCQLPADSVVPNVLQDEAVFSEMQARSLELLKDDNFFWCPRSAWEQPVKSIWELNSGLP
jgi:hypothetical protein